MIRCRLRRLIDGVRVIILAIGLFTISYINVEISSVDANQPDICTPITATPYAGGMYQIDSYLSDLEHTDYPPSPEISSVPVVGSELEDANTEETDDASIEETEHIEQSSQSATTDEYPVENNEVTYHATEEQTEDIVIPEEVEDTTSELSAAIEQPLADDDNLIEQDENNAVSESEEVNVNTIYACSSTLNRRNGRVQGPSGEETYYNLDMCRCVKRMSDYGYNYEYWVREDGVKMYGPYIMVAADLNTRPLGTILESSLGTAIVVDTGDFSETNSTQIDIATEW